VNYDWEPLGDRAFRTRLPFLDVTVGVIGGDTGTLLVDAGTTLAEAAAIAADVQALGFDPVTDIAVTHLHFDHVLGCVGFPGARVVCSPQVITAMTTGTDRLRAHALEYGADADEIDEVIAGLPVPAVGCTQAVIDLGGRTVAVSHPGAGHTDHDLIVVLADTDRPVVFCGDLVEESGDPVINTESDCSRWPSTLDAVLAAGGPDAVYVPGHGALVDAHFVARQRDWLATR
jgi:glyoxylase-like metal-dependent hydrolase (beta-lactamase superfamily II)